MQEVSVLEIMPVGATWNVVPMKLIQNETSRRAILDVAIWWSTATALAVLTWWPLVRGAGLIGGDIYTYFFPLKMWYWWCLKQGELALWNPLVGHGFPTLGESQTGVLYPFNLILYRLLPLNEAYNWSFILHYVLAFGFSCHFLRAMGATRVAALFASLVLVYGWFPPRSCLEWAAVTGAWLPGLLWLSLRLLQTGAFRYFVAAQLFLCFQLLAGHYHLAFITALCCVVLCITHWHATRALAVTLAFVLGGLLAAPQLLCTWELKERSHRSEPVFLEREISYGRVPLEYVPQFLMPWRYYPRVRDDDAWRVSFFGKHYTNQAEAHLYFGMLPLALAVAGLVFRPPPRVLVFCVALFGAGLVLATGVLVPWLKHLPGFGYFTGPGRYGLMCQVGVSVLAALTLDRLLALLRSPGFRAVAILLAFSLTWLDLWWVATLVQIARVTDDPPVRQLSQGLSPIQNVLPRMCRVLGKSENALTLLGVSQLPAYIGLSPREYLDDVGAIPFRWNKPPDTRVRRWLYWAGVEYIISAEPLPFLGSWPADIAWFFPDPVVAPLLGVPRNHPIRVYRLRNARGRCYTIPADTPLERLEPFAEPPDDIRPVRDYEATGAAFHIRVETDQPRLLILTDLLFPGWRVTIDGKEVPVRKASIFRAVEVPAGKHDVVWRYYPTYLNHGLALACLAFLANLVLALVFKRAQSPLRPPPDQGSEAGGTEPTATQGVVATVPLLADAEAGGEVPPERDRA